MGRILWVTERQRSPHRKNIHFQRPLDFYSRSGCFTHCYVDTDEPYSSSIQGQKKQKEKQVHLTTQGTSNQRLSPGSVQSKMFTLCVFPLPVPCSWAWRREWGIGEGGVGAGRRREGGSLCKTHVELRGEARLEAKHVQRERTSAETEAEWVLPGEHRTTNRSLMRESEGKNGGRKNDRGETWMERRWRLGGGGGGGAPIVAEL